MERKYFEGFDGERLSYCQSLNKKAKANVLILHGLKENALRYAHFAKFLSSNGFNAIVPDLRAHGESLERAITADFSPDESLNEFKERVNSSRGITKKKDVFGCMIRDILDLCKLNEGLPLVVIGFSLGSFLAQRLYTILPAEGYILISSGYIRPSKMRFFATLLKIGAFFAGTRRSVLVERKVFNEKNPKGRAMCNNFYYSVFKNVSRLYSKGFGAANANVPILLMAGGGDHVSRYGTMAQGLQTALNKRGVSSELLVYAGAKHKILQDEICMEAAYNDILRYLDKIGLNKD